MTTLNAATIAKIKYIANTAHEDCALTTLKNAKSNITVRTKIFAGYESKWDGIDREEVMAAFEQAMDCTRKADFTRRLELLLETMRNMEIEAERLEAITSRDHVTYETIAPAQVIMYQGAMVKVEQVAHHAGYTDFTATAVHGDHVAVGRMRAPHAPQHYGDLAYILVSNDESAPEVADQPIMHIEPTTADSGRLMVAGEHVADYYRDPRTNKITTGHGTFIFYMDAAKAAVKARDAARIANRDHGYWITAQQIAAAMAESADYTAEQIAFRVVAQIKEIEERARYADELKTAQTEYDAAQVATCEALELATQVELTTGDATDSPEFAAYEASEAALMVATGKLLKAAGRYTISIAREMGKSVADIEALKTLFMPAFTNQVENYHAGKRNELVAQALAIPADEATRH
ncbi:TPA: hypothetical protein QH074_004330 [Enterobacter hormaechei subsp. steigerwaltii]|nr:hypothetical protein [Enterobacter hormaechei subsp. steigerwaltii]